MFKDYYAILDIALDSDSLTIKKAYRMMSIRWHPDKNPNTEWTHQLLGIIPNIFPNVKDSMYFCRISDTD